MSVEAEFPEGGGLDPAQWPFCHVLLLVTESEVQPRCKEVGKQPPHLRGQSGGNLRLFLMAQTQFLLLLLVHGSHGELPQTQI